MPIQNLSGVSTATTSTQFQSPPSVNRDEAVANSNTTNSNHAETKPVANQRPQSSSSLAQEKQEAEKAAKAIQQFVTPLNNTLQFSVDQDSGRTVVKVIDSATHTVIKQFPSEEAIALSKALDKITGLLVEQKV